MKRDFVLLDLSTWKDNVRVWHCWSIQKCSGLFLCCACQTFYQIV